MRSGRDFDSARWLENPVRVRLTFMIGLAVCSLACTTDSPACDPCGLGETAQPALHAVQNDRLKDLMDEINSLLFERMRTELDIDRERRLRSAQIAEVAQAMSRTIERVLATQPELDLSPTERETFLALVRKLKSQAGELEEQARRNAIDAIARSLDQMAQTCTACHRLFRETPDDSVPEFSADGDCDSIRLREHRHFAPRIVAAKSHRPGCSE